MVEDKLDARPGSVCLQTEEMKKMTTKIGNMDTIQRKRKGKKIMNRNKKCNMEEMDTT
jgi:tricorn protease-like protein